MQAAVPPNMQTGGEKNALSIGRRRHLLRAADCQIKVTNGQQAAGMIEPSLLLGRYELPCRQNFKDGGALAAGLHPSWNATRGTSAVIRACRRSAALRTTWSLASAAHPRQD